MLFVPRDVMDQKPTKSCIKKAESFLKEWGFQDVGQLYIFEADPLTREITNKLIPSYFAQVDAYVSVTSVSSLNFPDDRGLFEKPMESSCGIPFRSLLYIPDRGFVMNHRKALFGACFEKEPGRKGTLENIIKRINELSVLSE